MRRNNIKKIREKKGVSQKTLEKKLGISISEIYKIENNDKDNVLNNNEDLIQKFCKYFSVEKKNYF